MLRHHSAATTRLIPSAVFGYEDPRIDKNHPSSERIARAAVQIGFIPRAPGLSHLGKKPCPLVCKRQLPCTSKRRARPTPCASNSSGDNGSNEENEDPELSRRVFIAGISVTSFVTAAAGYRFVIGEDLESRFKSRIAKRFPKFFPPEKTPEERRKPLNNEFAKSYFEAVGDVAVKLKLVSLEELHREEDNVKRRAYDLFFDNGPVAQSFSNASWLNFLLYSRLHVISQKTSPKSRIEFVDQLAAKTMNSLNTVPLKQSKDEARRSYEQWIANIRGLLGELVDLGWISGFRIEEFDGGLGSSWQDESRGSLTVYSFDPVTIQAAQLIGEEQYEEISPKPSGWIKAYLKAMGIKATLEDYYLDDAYRPDPDQFKPSQLATQFDLSL